MTDSAIQPVPAVDARKALRLTLAVPGQSAVERERQVSAFLEYARALGLDLSRQWRLNLDGRVVAAVTCLEPPGRTAMLFLPDGRLALSPEGDVVEALLRHAVGEESKRDVCLIQCLIDPDDAANRAKLIRAGFGEIATLVYMERWLPSDAPFPPTAPADESLQWSTYDEQRDSIFAQLLVDTYRESLDCPGLTGLREVEDIIAGHRGAGIFDPGYWWIVMRDGEPAGCILLIENPLRPVLELAYMGVHPDQRRRGLARLLLTHGLHVARRDGFEAVTLAVDAANQPAFALYASFGFQETARRRALIRRADSSSIRL